MFMGVFKELTDNDLYLLVAHAECDYKMPIEFNEELIVSATITRIGNTSFDIDYRLFSGNDKTYATARTVMVCFDNLRKSTVTVPECIKAVACIVNNSDSTETSMYKESARGDV